MTKCTDCKQEIKGERTLEFGLKKWNEPVCYDCGQKRNSSSPSTSKTKPTEFNIAGMLTAYAKDEVVAKIARTEKHIDQISLDQLWIESNRHVWACYTDFKGKLNE